MAILGKFILLYLEEYIWNDCEVLTLTKSMRLRSGSDPIECLEIEQFSKWILKIEEGKIFKPNDGYA